MRGCATLLLLVAACGDTTSTSGPRLVAVNEGEAITIPVSKGLPVSQAFRDESGAAIAWAHVSAEGAATIEPPCSLLSYAQESPVLFTVLGDDVPIVVQVSPSIIGACLPRITACVGTRSMPCTENDPRFVDPATSLRATPQLATSFYAPDGTCERILPGTPISCDWGDAPILFHVYDPAVLDQPETSTLVARITTDAPLVFQADSSSFEPAANPGSNGSLTATLYDANVIGRFGVSYEIAAEHANFAQVATGSFQLNVRPSGIGIEPQYCASECATSVTCCGVAHGQTRSPTDRSVSLVVRNATDSVVTTGLRVWTRGLSVTQVCLTGDGNPALTYRFHSNQKTGDCVDLQFVHGDAVSAFATADVTLASLPTLPQFVTAGFKVFQDSCGATCPDPTSNAFRSSLEVHIGRGAPDPP